MIDALAQFRDALERRSIIPPAELIADGKIHRCDADGKNGKDDASYVLHLDGIAAGAIANWRDGLGLETWSAKIERKLSPVEAVALQNRIEASKRLAAAEAEQLLAQARAKAVAILKRSEAAPEDHPYLIAKGVKPHGLRLYKGTLVVPVRDESGELHSLQFIPPDGKDKRFLKGGRVTGCYHSIGKPADTLCIVEGYATGASIYEATGHPVVIAFDASRLPTIAKVMRARFPAARLILCADDDHRTEGNPGIAKATEAALAVGGLIAMPEFGNDRPDDATDFNDMMRLCGPEAVQQAVADAKAPDKLNPSATVSSATADDSCGSGPHVVVRRLSEIEAKPIRWLWPDRIARGKVSMIVGHPGLGKSQVTAALAAVVTTGGKWPVDRTACERGSVILLNAEDDAADTIRPRLEATGADVSRIEIIEAIADGYHADGRENRRGFNLKADLGALDALLAARSDVALVVIDPVSAYLSGVDTHVNADVRAILAPLGELAARHGVAIVAVSHFNKVGANKPGTGEALLRVSGSLAFVAAARAAYAVVQDQETPSRRLLLSLKNNVGKPQPGLAFSINSHWLASGIETSMVLWEPEPVTITADEAMAPPVADEERTMTDEAADMLRETLLAGRVSAKDLKRQGADAGISDKALRNARIRLGITVEREGFGIHTKTFWRLPTSPLVPTTPINAPLGNRAQMDSEGTNGGADGTQASDTERF
jgi:putative DNA primase/helicase